MNSFSIAYRNFKSNLRTYGLHLAAMIFAVVVYYNFMSLKYNPEVLQVQKASSKVTTAANSTAVVLLIFLVFFIWYSSSFFLNQRKKEIGIYTFMGIEKYKIALIFAIETLFLGLTSIIVGLGLGMLLGKLFMMALAKVALLSMTISFFVSIKGLAETAVTFLILFIITAIKGYFDITRSNLIDLFNALRKEEGMPKANYLKGILSLVLIGVGYYVSVISVKVDFMLAALTTIGLVVWGTYWLFGSFFTIASKHLTERKSILYKGINIISISNLVFKIRKNYRTLATIAVLTATTITAFGTVSSLRYYINQNYDIEVPYTFSFISSDAGLKQQVAETINKSKHDLLLWENVNYLKIDQVKTNYRTGDTSLVALKLSDFKKLTKDLQPKHYQRILEETALNRGEAFYVEKPGVIMSVGQNRGSRIITIDKLNLAIRNYLRTPLFGNGVPKAAIVIRDKDYETLRERFNEQMFNGIIVKNEEETKELAGSLFKVIPEEASYFSYYQVHRSSYDYYGILYFLGAFMALVFIIATGSIIYFKLLSDASEDKDKYQMLRKIGMTQEEIVKSISRQIGVSFSLPLVVGSIHSLLAIRVLSKLLNYNLIVPTVISIISFTVIYGIFYYCTTRKFLDIVFEGEMSFL